MVLADSPSEEHITVIVAVEEGRSTGIAAIGTDMVVPPGHVYKVYAEQDHQTKAGQEQPANSG